MQIHLIAVGKIKEKYLQVGVAEYTKRLHPYVNLNILEIAEEKRHASPSGEKAAIEKEGERILAVISPRSSIIALDVKGTGCSSEELAGYFRQQELAGKNQVTFIIGGDLGLSSAVLSRSDLRLSLSKMTFTHTLARLLLLEQVYRVCRINSGEPYHK